MATIRLNRRVLVPGHKRYAAVVFFGDIHYGHPQCDIERASALLKWAVKNHVYVLGMGDYIECATRYSVGDSVYHQRGNAQEQMAVIEEMLAPVARHGLLLGLLRGNHEDRISLAVGYDITKVLAKSLGVPYLGYACWNLLKVGRQNYTLYAWHGAGGSAFKHSKLKKAIDVAAHFEADIVAVGHYHSRVAETIMRQRVNTRNKTVEERKIHILITGSYLKYDDTYAQVAGMPLTSLGSPTVRLHADVWDIHSRV